MRPRTQTNYLSAYPEALVQEVRGLIEQGRFAERLLQKYPVAHTVRTDRALYDFVTQIKQDFLRNAAPLSRVAYDGSLQIMKQALGMHTGVSRVQGMKLKASREIRVAALFKQMPLEFLRMIAVHELAHFREQEHNKAFYQLCLHMEPEYHQLEFELRAYLTYLDAGSLPLW